MMNGKATIRAIIILFALRLSAGAQTITGKVVAIADGDTLTVLDASNQQRKIRLDGIDAPESHQDYGQRAKQSLSDLVFGKTVTVIGSKTDRYGCTLGKVTLDGRDINLEQINRGIAWYYRQYSKELKPEDAKAYERAEIAAKDDKLGLWADPNPIPPWMFRRDGREVPLKKVTPAITTGEIIGNRNSKIYHLPNCPDYNKVSERNREMLERMIEMGRIESGVRRIGAEQEMFLIDRAMRPAPVALEILKNANDRRLTTELGKFNLEANLSPGPLAGRSLREMEEELSELMTIARRAARSCDADVLLTGILPTPYRLAVGGGESQSSYYVSSYPLTKVRFNSFCILPTYRLVDQSHSIVRCSQL